MITILHGDHHVQSRDALTKLVNNSREAGRQITHLEGKKVELSQLLFSLSNQSLFGDPKTIVIQELHSLPKSKKKEELISALTASDSTTDVELILWEKKQLGVTELKKFPSAKVQVFTPTRSLFSWLNSLTGQQTDQAKAKMLNLLRQATESDGEQFCFAMLNRQLRLLMEAREAEPGNPQFQRLLTQANSFSWKQLFELHRQVLLIDQSQKNSTTTFSLSSQLELLIAAL